MVSAEVIIVRYYVGPNINLHGRITAMEYENRLVNQMHQNIQTLLPNNDAVFQDGNAPIHKPELFSHGLKSMNLNFNIFPGQHNHQI
jgi:hypothetical protein